MKRTLTFKNQALEEEFLSNHNTSFVNCEHLCNKMLLCLLITYTAKYIVDAIFVAEFDYTRIAGVIIIYAAALFYFLGRYLIKKFQVKSKNSDWLILILSLLLVTLLNNPIRLPIDEEDRASFSLFYYGFEVGVYNLVVVHALKYWYTKMIYFFVLCVYFLGLYQQTPQDHLQAVKMAGFVVMCFFLFYFSEKGLRLTFLAKHHEGASTKHIFQALPEGVLIIDNKFNCLHSNPALKNLFSDLNTDSSLDIKTFTQNICQPQPQPKTLFGGFQSEISRKLFQALENIRNELPPDSAKHGFNFDDELTDKNRSNPLNHNSDFSSVIKNLPNSLRRKMSRRKASSNKDINSPIVIFDSEGGINQTNNNTFTLPNISASLHSYINAFFEAFHEADCNKINNFDEVLEHYYFDAKYEEKSLEISISFLTFLNKRCFLLIFRDKTYSELITKLENTSRFKSRVLATVSHELRTPVNSTLHLLNTILETPDVPPACTEAYVKPAKKILVMMLNLINDFLDYSQINEDKLKLFFQPVDIRTLIRETAGLIEIQAKKKGIYLKLEMDALIPPLFETDPNRFTQILLNLLSNALKFTSKGGITVSAKLLADEIPNRLLEVSVRDTGIGIKDEEISKLFMGYEKIELGENQKMNPNGCGLGLSIANKLAINLSREDFQGISVESTLGEGSTFSFIIENKKRKDKLTSNLDAPQPYGIRPLSKLPKGHSKFLEAKHSGSPGPSLQDVMEIFEDEVPVSKRWPKKFVRNNRSCHTLTTDLVRRTSGTKGYFELVSDENRLICTCPKILIVDDDAFNVLTLESILKSLSLSYKSCFNGQEAVSEVIERSQAKLCGSSNCRNFNLIFMDCNMPIKNGFEAAKDIKHYLQLKGLDSIPITGLSAHSEAIGKDEAIEAGMDYYLTKPASKDKIREIILKAKRNDPND